MVSFGGKKVNCNFVQPTVLKCRVPATEEPGFVSVELLLDDQVFGISQNSEQFEYKEAI